MTFEPTRRGLLIGLGGIVLSSPAIVRAPSLMKIKAFAVDDLSTIISTGILTDINHEIMIAVLREKSPRVLAYDICNVQSMRLPIHPIFEKEFYLFAADRKITR